jgi:hypothetical protein
MDFTINFDSINILAVFVSTLIANLLGGIWYSPFAFGKIWRQAAGITANKPMSNPAAAFTAGFVLQLMAVSLLAALLGPSSSGIEGLQLGSLLAFGFVFTALSITNLFERRPVPLILINAGYHIATMSLVGFILGSWG